MTNLGPDPYRGAYDSEWQIARNKEAIEEFRANGGTRPGRPAPQLLLHTTGRQSGLERISPLAYFKVDSGWAIFGAASGAAKHPAWYLNIVANPEATIEIGTETLKVVGREATGQERESCIEHQASQIEHFAESVRRSAPHREIPVIVLEPVG